MLQNYYGIARTTAFGAATKTCKYGSYKSITGLQELQHLVLQHLVLLQKLANTVLTNLLQDCKNLSIGVSTNSFKYLFCKNITELREPQHLKLHQRLANTAVTKL